jgi:hypothetical protein
MRRGIKPFAAFSEFYPEKWSLIDRVLDELRDTELNATLIVREYVALVGGRQGDGILGIRRLLLALPSEAWRVDAFILLQSIGEQFGWDDKLVRMEGALLGYENWQIDAFLRLMPAAR